MICKSIKQHLPCICWLWRVLNIISRRRHLPFSSHSSVAGISATSFWMLCLSDGISLGGGALNTLLFKCPHRKLSQAERSGDLAGQGKFPYLQMTWSGNNLLRTSMETLAVWLVTASCWNHISALIAGYVANWGVKNVSNIYTERSEFTVTLFSLPTSKKYGPIIPKDEIAHHTVILTLCRGTTYMRFFGVCAAPVPIVLFIHISREVEMGLIAHYHVVNDIWIFVQHFRNLRQNVTRFTETFWVNAYTSCIL